MDLKMALRNTEVLARIAWLNTRVEGMRAANDICRLEGRPPAHGEDDFKGLLAEGKLYPWIVEKYLTGFADYL